MRLSIIIPAHNEEATIQTVLERVLAVELPGWEKEMIVVDDGSTDGTGQIVSGLMHQLGIPFLSGRTKMEYVVHEQNRGKGEAVRTGLGKATGDYIIIQDADLEYDPADIPKLLEQAKNGCTAVFGARGSARYPERGFHYVIGAKLLTWTADLLYGAHLTDLYTGYKLFRSEDIKCLPLTSRGFEFEAEVSCRLLKHGCKVAEVPISYKPRNREQGKHIGWTDAVKGFWVIIRERIT